MPVTGTSPVIAMILTATPARTQENTPITTSLSFWAFVYSATFNMRSNMAVKTNKIRNKPMKPNVSPIMANTESLIDSGR